MFLVFGPRARPDGSALGLEDFAVGLSRPTRAPTRAPRPRATTHALHVYAHSGAAHRRAAEPGRNRLRFHSTTPHTLPILPPFQQPSPGLLAVHGAADSSIEEAAHTVCKSAYHHLSERWSRSGRATSSQRKRGAGELLSRSVATPRELTPEPAGGALDSARASGCLSQMRASSRQRLK